MEQLLTKKDVASLFRVTERTVSAWMQEGLVHFRRGQNAVRFEEKAVREWYEKHVTTIDKRK